MTLAKFILATSLIPLSASDQGVLHSAEFKHQCSIDINRKLICPSEFISDKNVFFSNKIFDDEENKLVLMQQLKSLLECNSKKGYSCELKTYWNENKNLNLIL